MLRASRGRAVPQPPAKDTTMDQDDIINIIDDGDPRNARVRVVRHPSPLRPGTYPVAGPRVIPPFQPTVYQQPSYPAYPPASYPGYPPASYPAYPQGSIVVQRPRRFLDMPTGEVLALAAQAFAALQPLPAAPVALGKADDDVSNLITYQSALAIHAKRDEQLRTIGSLLAKFLA